MTKLLSIILGLLILVSSCGPLVYAQTINVDADGNDIMDAAYGGTNIDTSSSTGWPFVNSGTWTISGTTVSPTELSYLDGVTSAIQTQLNAKSAAFATMNELNALMSEETIISATVLAATKLDDMATPDDNTDLNATQTYHGLLPKLSGTGTHFLSGVGTWLTPSTYLTRFNEIADADGGGLVHLSTYGQTWDFDTDGFLEFEDVDTNGSIKISYTAGQMVLGFTGNAILQHGPYSVEDEEIFAQTGYADGDWFSLAAYDVNGSAYQSLLRPVASNTPHLEIGPPTNYLKFAQDGSITLEGSATLTATDHIGIAISDETTDLTTGTAKATFRMPFAMTLTAVRANVNTAPVGATLTIDINEGGTTVLSTKLTIDASEETSTTAATAAVISDSALADDGEITIDIDQIGSSTAGKGAKIWLIGTRAF